MVCVCVCRYSLPVNFQAVVMKPNKKAQKRLTETLNQLYGHLDSRFIESEAEVGCTCSTDTGY